MSLSVSDRYNLYVKRNLEGEKANSYFTLVATIDPRKNYNYLLTKNVFNKFLKNLGGA